MAFVAGGAFLFDLSSLVGKDRHDAFNRLHLGSPRNGAHPEIPSFRHENVLSWMFLEVEKCSVDLYPSIVWTSFSSRCIGTFISCLHRTVYGNVRDSRRALTANAHDNSERQLYNIARDSRSALTLAT
jgi:hypothetical protein